MDDRSNTELLVRYARIAGLLTFVALLYVARDVLVPLALGGLFSFVLSPLVSKIKRIGCSNGVAVFAAVSVVFLLLSAFLFSLWSGGVQVAEQAADFRRELSLKADGIRAQVSAFTDQLSGTDATARPSTAASDEPVAIDTATEPTVISQDVTQAVPQRPATLALRATSYQDWLGSAMILLGPIGNAGVIAVFALFALLYREDIRDRFTTIIARGNYVITTQAINAASARIGKYLIAQLLMNFFYGLVFSVGLIFIGQLFSQSHTFPYAWLLGMIAGLVRFLPYVGPVVGAIVPIFFALALFPGYAVAVGVTILLLVMELVFNNVVEPLLYGSSTGVSPIAIILAAVFWGWIWGPVGILLATPLTVCVVVLGEFVPRFRFLSRLLSDRSQIEPAVLVYQRLLINDRFKVADYLKFLTSQHAPRELLDLVIVPTTKMIKLDSLKHSKNSQELLKLFDSGLADAGFFSPRAKEVHRDVSISKPAVFGVGTRGLEDAFVLKCLQAAFVDCIELELPSQQGTPNKLCLEIMASNPPFVLLLNTPPGGLVQTKFWCRELRSAGYNGIILVASLGRFRHFDKRFVQVRKSGADWMTSTVDQSVRKVLALAQEQASLTIQSETQEA